jgi:Fuseless
MLAFALQAPLAAVCSRVTGFWRIVVMDVFTAIAYVGSVNVWRGLWNLYDIYLFPGAPLTEQVATGAFTQPSLSLKLSI